MPKVIILSFFAVLIFSALSAQDAGQSKDMLLKQLDRTITNREVYTAKREGQFDEIKARLLSEDSDAWIKWDECGRLVDGYLSFQIDSAIKYAFLKKEFAIKTGDSLKILETDLNLAQIYSISGLYEEAFSIVNSIPQKWDTDFLESYARNIKIHIYETRYSSLGSPHLKHKYYGLLHNAYMEMLKESSPERDGFSHYYTMANLLCLEGKYTVARKWLEDNAEEILDNAREESIYWFLMGRICRSGAGTKEEAESFFAKSAIADLTLGIKEHSSLLDLAQMLYADGEISSAYKYLKVALEDAQYCNSQKRMVSASQLFPIVDSDYQIKKSRQQRNLYISLGVSIALVILLITAFVYISRLYGSKRRINRQLVAANFKLKQLNTSLEEANLIKETYIVHYIDYCLNNIDKMDMMLKSISRFIRDKDTSSLKKATDFTLITKENLEKFYEYFDHTFLNLFPDFVSEYNKLLKQEENVIPKKEGRLNTELRIYALIRLGITDSVQIARFLHCSVSTVYNNRTSARNKAMEERNDFEKKVASLCKINAGQSGNTTDFHT